MAHATGGSGTVIGCFLDRAEQRATQPIWYHQTGGRWLPITWSSARAAVLELAAGLATLGIGPGDRVGLAGANRPHWVIADYAIQHIGAVVVPIYATSPPDQIAQLLLRTHARVCVVDGDDFLGKLREASVDGLEHVVALHLGDVEHDRLIGHDTLVRRGEDWLEENPTGLSDRLAAIGPDDVATVIFTSGTGGDPKGSILTHGNLLWAADACARAVEVRTREITLSYLPLAHAFERVVTTVIPLVATSERFTCWFVEEIAKLPSALRSVRPTIFVAVPLVWARMEARIQAEIGTTGFLRRRMSRAMLTAGGSAVRKRDEQESVSPPARVGAGTAGLMGRRILKKVGLGRCWYAVSGAAPLQPETQQFFQALGLGLHQGWGLTETAALCAVQRPDDLEIGMVGAPLDGVEIKLGMDGEVLVRGPNVFSGYEGDPDLTAEAIDEDGFFHTGDVGRLTGDHRLEIIDRLKDVIITAGGRKVAPRAIEDRLRADPLISGAMVFGEGRSYLTALISLDGQTASDIVETNPDNETGLWEHPKVHQRVDRAVGTVNRSLSESEQVHGFAILPFGFPDEALTPTLKLKRRVVEETFADLIEGMYA
ncbi:MAG TPA: long-chain fatty acid--CoA ligase [Acidimicrobiia bacterium]